MYTRYDIKDPSDLLLPRSARGNTDAVYFVRLCFCDEEVLNCLWRYHEAAARKGVIIEGQITNPDERQLRYLEETLGTEFALDIQFIENNLKKWMPRMQSNDREAFAGALFNRLCELRDKGKTESILKNIYTKIMCWLYYRFERIVPNLSDDDPPRILYECPSITRHELILLRILSALGADILLLECTDDSAYRKADADSAYSQLLYKEGKPFPPNFTLKAFRKEHSAKAPANPVPSVSRSAAPMHIVHPTHEKIDINRYIKKPAHSLCTNAWMKDAAFTQILTPPVQRGSDPDLLYNAYVRLSGTYDKLTYSNELYQFYMELKASGRNIVIVDGQLPMVEPDEIAKVKRRPYQSVEEMIIDISANLPSCADTDLQNFIRRSFARVMQEAAVTEPKINKLVVAAVYLICRIQKYQTALFRNYRSPGLPCFILMGGCRNQNDAQFIQFLAGLPCDVLILAPDLNRPCILRDDTLLDLKGDESVMMMSFPADTGTVQMRTVASSAEQDLNASLYADSGLYRSHQFAKAESITLQTTYDEIFMLWNEELKYRTHFMTTQQTVSMPVIYAKIAGVENNRADLYWQKIKSLITDNTRFADRFPMQLPGEFNPFESLAIKALRNGVIQRDMLKSDRQYPFTLLRDEMQEHILDKLQLMLDRRLIKGTFVNGTEYTVIATVLNMKKEIIRQLHSFDFTGKNPKLVCVAAGDQTASLQDTIVLTFLNLIGFDIAVFVPTGYRVIEQYMNENLPVEHQIGAYMYDLNIPDFKTLPPVKGRSWLENLFRRGN